MLLTSVEGVQLRDLNGIVGGIVSPKKDTVKPEPPSPMEVTVLGNGVHAEVLKFRGGH